MENAQEWVHPTQFTGEYPNGFAGFTFLDFDSKSNAYHPGEDYNWSDGTGGNADLGKEVKATSAGIVVHTSKASTGYGNLCVIKHQLGYNMKRFIKEMYGIETDVLYSLYAHLKDILVAVGNKVDTGSLIAHVGNTGTQWAHLHFEIYAPIGELAKTDWRFYPSVAKGWTKEKTKQYYLPAYKFIEASKQIDDIIGSFMGKPKDYWIQVEKDRESLLMQIGQKDKEWAVKMDEQRKMYEKTISEKEIEISNKNTELLNKGKELEVLQESAKKASENFAKKEESYQTEISSLKIKISQILDDNAENYKFWDAVSIAVKIALKKIQIK